MNCDLKNHKYFKHAIKAIENHPHFKELKSLHAAVLVKGNNILSVGINKPKRNVFSMIYTKHPNCTVHSECQTVAQARKKINLRGAKMYVARILKKDNSIALSKPCPWCQLLMKNYGIKRVYFTVEDGSYEMMRI